MTKNIQNAINKASKIKCAVKLLGRRRYLVVTPQQRKYTVKFEMHDGLRYGLCNCKAANANRCCYHIAKAAVVDTAIQNMQAH